MFKTDFQKNKDWNIVRQRLVTAEPISFKTDFQKNKDWNNAVDAPPRGFLKV